jgi:capsular polysaccharide biosynthesis protein
MIQETLGLRKSLLIFVGIFAMLGLLAGAGSVALRPPVLTSTALVALPPSTRDTSTQVAIASSNPVLAGALHSVRPAMPLLTLRDRIQVTRLTSNIISMSAQGKTAAHAEGTANAVADSYVAYLSTSQSSVGTVRAHLLERATNATGKSLPGQLIVVGGLGALLAALVAAIDALAFHRGDRRRAVFLQPWPRQRW